MVNGTVPQSLNIGQSEMAAKNSTGSPFGLIIFPFVFFVFFVMFVSNWLILKYGWCPGTCTPTAEERAASKTKEQVETAAVTAVERLPVTVWDEEAPLECEPARGR